MYTQVTTAILKMTLYLFEVIAGFFAYLGVRMAGQVEKPDTTCLAFRQFSKRLGQVL